jgi:hypothetical protein
VKCVRLLSYLHPSINEHTESFIEEEIFINQQKEVRLLENRGGWTKKVEPGTPMSTLTAEFALAGPTSEPYLVIPEALGCQRTCHHLLGIT